MRKFALLIAFGGLVVVAGWGPFTQPGVDRLLSGETAAIPGEPKPRRADAGATRGGASFVFAPVLSWSSADLMQHFQVSDYRNVAITETYISEGESGSSLPTSTYYGTASFDISAACSGGKNRIYLGGVDGTGKAVVQQWTLKSIGSPGEAAIKVMAKKELYRGDHYRAPKLLGVDLQRRFLLLVAEDVNSVPAIARIELPAGGIPITLLVDGGPAMPVGEMAYVTPFLHPQYGAVWYFSSLGFMGNGGAFEKPSIVLVDISNDAAIDSIMADDSFAFRQSGHAPMDNNVVDMIHY